MNRLTGYIFRQGVAGAFTTSLKEPVSVLVDRRSHCLQVTVFNEPVAPIFVALLLFHRGMQAVISMQSGWQNTMDRIGSVEMVDDEFEVVLDIKSQSGTSSPRSLQEASAFRTSRFAYDEDDGDVLRGVDVSIPANTTVALVGESGAGSRRSSTC